MPSHNYVKIYRDFKNLEIYHEDSCDPSLFSRIIYPPNILCFILIKSQCVIF